MGLNPIEIIKENDGRLFEQIRNSSDLAFESGEIPKKYKLLIALGIDAALKADNGVKILARQALDMGAKKEEIVEVLRIVHYISGVNAAYPASIALKDLI